MGLIADIYTGSYRSPHCHLDGKTAVTIVNIPGPFEPTDERPAVALETRNFAAGPVHSLVPVVAIDEPAEAPSRDRLWRDAVSGTWWTTPPDACFAMGGRYVGTPDSRFRDRIGFYGAVALHDYDMAREPIPTCD